MCGQIGCGRYNLMHAVEHFDRSNHSFSIELSCHRIWNYRGDNYVHRLIKTKIDNDRNKGFDDAGNINKLLQ